MPTKYPQYLSVVRQMQKGTEIAYKYIVIRKRSVVNEFKITWCKRNDRKWDDIKREINKNKPT